MFPNWAWSGSREQFLHCGLRKFRHSKSSVCRWYTQLNHCRFVYDTYRTTEAIWSRHGWVHMFITHQPTVTLQLHNFDLFMTCRTSSFCTVAWQLARFQLTRRIARSLGDSWASCLIPTQAVHKSAWKEKSIKNLAPAQSRRNATLSSAANSTAEIAPLLTAARNYMYFRAVKRFGLSWMPLIVAIGCFFSCRPESEARFTKYLTTILRLSYDNAKVTINLRRTSNLQNILQLMESFL